MDNWASYFMPRIFEIALVVGTVVAGYVTRTPDNSLKFSLLTKDTYVSSSF